MTDIRILLFTLIGLVVGYVAGMWTGSNVMIGLGVIAGLLVCVIYELSNLRDEVKRRNQHGA